MRNLCNKNKKKFRKVLKTLFSPAKIFQKNFYWFSDIY